MVMEAPPSPDSVGREFVRQYYTLLNKAPTHLHRFYNNQSSFVHGGLDPPNRETSPMIGQKQIHQKIQQLNFRDCHAKITQVDAQATLGSGVVVQVTGELSNAGQPMRRFTQTFVLAAQSPKKYYVHNDIFRYQDEIISDEELEPENRSDVDEEINQERPNISEMPPIAQQPMPYYNPTAAPPIQGTLPPVHHQTVQPPHVMPPQPAPVINGSVHPEELNVIPGPQMVAAGQGPNIGAPLAGMPPQPPMTNTMPLEDTQPQQPIIEDAVVAPEPGQNENAFVEMTSQVEPEQSDIISETPLSNEPKTYANLLKTGGSTTYAAASQINACNVPPKPSSPPLANRFDRDMQNSNANTQNHRNNINRNPRPAARMTRQDSGRGGPGKYGNDDGTFEDRRRSQNSNAFGDSYQLFLGNLPHHITEHDLQEIFSQYGTIVDLKIHNKANIKGPLQARCPPYYGFITYENQQAVADCLAAKPIYFPKNDKINGIMLNVEEKKTKDRSSYGGSGRISMDNNGGQRTRDNNGPRRGGGGQGGPPRGGGSGNMSGSGNRPNNFSRGGGGGGQTSRVPTNSYNNRR